MYVAPARRSRPTEPFQGAWDAPQSSTEHLPRDISDIELKVGHAKNLPRRVQQYRKCESAAQEIVWHGFFYAERRMHVERRIHLALERHGAVRIRGECQGYPCTTHHREYFNMRTIRTRAEFLRICRGELRAAGEKNLKLHPMEDWYRISKSRVPKSRVRKTRIPRYIMDVVLVAEAVVRDVGGDGEICERKGVGVGEHGGEDSEEQDETEENVDLGPPGAQRASLKMLRGWTKQSCSSARADYFEARRFASAGKVLGNIGTSLGAARTKIKGRILGRTAAVARWSGNRDGGVAGSLRLRGHAEVARKAISGVCSVGFARFAAENVYAREGGSWECRSSGSRKTVWTLKAEGDVARRGRQWQDGQAKNNRGGGATTMRKGQEDERATEEDAEREAELEWAAEDDTALLAQEAELLTRAEELLGRADELERTDDDGRDTDADDAELLTREIEAELLRALLGSCEANDKRAEELLRTLLACEADADAELLAREEELLTRNADEEWSRDTDEAELRDAGEAEDTINDTRWYALPERAENTELLACDDEEETHALLEAERDADAELLGTLLEREADEERGTDADNENTGNSPAELLMREDEDERTARGRARYRRGAAARSKAVRDDAGVEVDAEREDEVETEHNEKCTGEEVEFRSPGRAIDPHEVRTKGIPATPSKCAREAATQQQNKRKQKGGNDGRTKNHPRRGRSRRYKRARRVRFGTALAVNSSVGDGKERLGEIL
ncbi:hypothetical protein C8R43DRAFT_943339 [Mycena crocata]|nr:hypothetical protein C8R43DRAFT_943339 [Mycena crocata]